MTSAPAPAQRLRQLVVVLGDQLDVDAAAFDDFDPAQDAVWMAEVAEESTHVWSTQARIVTFLAGMRHHAEAQRRAGRTVHYRRLDDPANRGTLADELREAVQRLAPQRLTMTAPGDWRVYQSLQRVAAEANLPLDVREDRHFYATVREFAAHARGRRSLRLEYWYRELRQRHGVLLEPDGEPVGGQWNYDADNRESFGRDGPGRVPARDGVRPDAVTKEVIALVRERFGDHPGRLDDYDWPLTRAQALASLERFVRERLPQFGRWQDALWEGEAWLYHSHLAAAMNLKLLHPREAVQAAEQAWRDGAVPLAAAEGYIRQILGWREYVRGLYWTRMPGYVELNALDAQVPLPAWYWTGETDAACLRDALGQTLRHGYAHHIQRLMVTGLYALLLGVVPRQVHEWYLAVYVDAVEWVELPNTLGMSQYADGGLMASKPYIASGQYLKRMSNHCQGCRYDPAQRHGERACPFTVLYWDFLLRHESRFAKHPRLMMQVKNVARLAPDERRAIQAEAERRRAAG